jgi:hypothetical protein
VFENSERERRIEFQGFREHGQKPKSSHRVESRQFKVQEDVYKIGHGLNSSIQ